MQVQVRHGLLHVVDEFDAKDVIPKIDFRFDNDKRILEWVFTAHNTNHFFGRSRNEKLGLRSLSVGDVVVLDGRHYLCKPTGWMLLFDRTDGGRES